MRGKGEGAVYKDAKRGLWVGTIELDPINGNRQRKTVRRKRKEDLMDELARLRLEMKRSGTLASSTMTVEQWFRYWLKIEVVGHRAPNTVSNYQTVVEKYIIPNMGKVKLDKVNGNHLRKVYDGMLSLGRAPTYTLNAHRIMSSAFTVAIREGKISTSPIARVSAPRKGAAPIETLDLAEGLTVLAHVASRDDGSRWATALLTGARRGEVIGLERDRITSTSDADGNTHWELDLSWQLQRIIWSHGCGDQVGTGPKGVKIFPCGRRGTDCPSKYLSVPADYEHRHVVGGLYLTRPKSSAGWRIIPLVDPLKSILLRYIDATPSNEYNLVFTRGGRPFDPDQDSKEWRRVLKETGIDKDARLHDVRHTTVELLYAAGVPEDIIMAIVGHSTVSMTRSYRTRTDTTRLRAAMEQFSLQFINPLELPQTPQGDAL